MIERHDRRLDLHPRLRRFRQRDQQGHGVRQLRVRCSEPHAVPVTGKESYVYDGYGRRAKVTTLGGVNAGKIDYPVYTMGGQLLTEDDARSNKTTDYISLNGSLVAKRAATIGTTAWATTYEHTDALHSPVTESNSSGVVNRIELYTPYGEPGDGSYTQGPGFTGHVTDSFTGLTYAQQRYYDPVVARFLEVAPLVCTASPFR